MNTSRASISAAVKIGVIGGIVAIFIALVGMIEAFATRDIIGDVIPELAAIGDKLKDVDEGNPKK